jgi:hypothetical protein
MIGRICLYGALPIQLNEQRGDWVIILLRAVSKRQRNVQHAEQADLSYHLTRPALVAQGIERRFPKPQVAGSIPAEGTRRPAFPLETAGFFMGAGLNDARTPLMTCIRRNIFALPARSSTVFGPAWS